MLPCIKNLVYPGSRAQGAPGLSFDFGDQDFNLDEDFEWKSPSEAFAEPFGKYSMICSYLHFLKVFKSSINNLFFLKRTANK